MGKGSDVRFANGIHQSDALDNQVLRELGSGRFPQWDVRESYASIAKRVGVNEETVRKRVRRLERLGTVQGWRVVIHPKLVGCSEAMIDLEVGFGKSKEGVLAELKLVDGVIVITNFQGRGSPSYSTQNRGRRS